MTHALMYQACVYGEIKQVNIYAEHVGTSKDGIFPTTMHVRGTNKIKKLL